MILLIIFVELFSMIDTFIVDPSYRSDGVKVEHPPHNPEVVGSHPGPVIPKTLKMVPTALSPGARRM